LNWKLFFLSFGMLFLAELGDKTQLSVFSLVTRHKAPIPIFLGASLALVVVTFIGAFLGEVVSRYIPERYMHLASSLFFLVIGIVMLWTTIPEFIKK
jgi:putative Ca2+/H+ antiporter (TMEM165/GDT1 family)